MYISTDIINRQRGDISRQRADVYERDRAYKIKTTGKVKRT